MQQERTNHPIRLAVDYPDRKLNRMTTFFRLLVALPILIVLGSVSGEAWSARSIRAGGSTSICN